MLVSNIKHSSTHKAAYTDAYHISMYNRLPEDEP
jgi:hypothetical protein